MTRDLFSGWGIVAVRRFIVTSRGPRRAERAEGTGDGSNVHRDPSASEPAHHRQFETNRVDHYPPYVGVKFCKRQ